VKTETVAELKPCSIILSKSARQNIYEFFSCNYLFRVLRRLSKADKALTEQIAKWIGHSTLILEFPPKFYDVIAIQNVLSFAQNIEIKVIWFSEPVKRTIPVFFAIFETIKC
jgi:hypothetical protein